MSIQEIQQQRLARHIEGRAIGAKVEAARPTYERARRLSSPRITLKDLVLAYREHNDELEASLSDSERRLAQRLSHPAIPPPAKLPTRIGR